MMKMILTAAATALTLTVPGKNITWTGASSTTWDTTTANWTDGTSAVAFADGDDVTITSGSAISFGANVSPGTVTFDIADDMTLTSGTYGFASGTRALVKRGAGTLSLSGGSSNGTSGNRNTCDWHIYGGFLKGVTDKAFSTFGQFSKPYTIYAHAGGTVWASGANLTGWANNGSHENNINLNVVVETGGTLRSSNIFTVRNLTLDGGSLHCSGYMTDYGFLKIIGRLTVTNTAYTFDFNYAQDAWKWTAANLKAGSTWWPFICLSGSSQTVIDVDDATGSEEADFTLKTPFIKSKNWKNVGWRKKGKGTMMYAPKEYGGYRNLATDNWIDGDIHVDEGTLVIGEQEAIRPEFDRTIFVYTNATLCLGRENAIYNANKDMLDVKTKIHVAGGTLRVYDTKTKTAHLHVGHLTLDNATFDYSGLGGFSQGNLGLMTINGLTLRGTNAYEFCAITNGYPDRVNWAHIHLWNDPVPVFDVEDITKDEKEDFTLRHRLVDRCTHRAVTGENYSTYESSGFVKRGAGTMCLDMKNSTFSGDVTVEEGVLKLGQGGGLNGDPGDVAVRKSYLGNMASNRTVTIAAGAKLEVSRRNTFGNMGMITNNQVKTKFIVRGTLEFSQIGSATRLPDVTFDDGCFVYPQRGGSEYGLTMFAGTVSFTGTKPYLWEPHEQGVSQWINLSGYPRTTFDVAEITGDGSADMTLALPLTIHGGSVGNGFKYGFVKTGAGTLRYLGGQVTFNKSGTLWDLSMNGDVSVSNGTLVVDGDLAKSDTVRVSAGAFAGGTGVVHHVSVEAGGGLSAYHENGTGLKVTGDLTLPETGRVDLSFPGAAGSRRMVTLATVSGTLTAPASLDGWTVLVDGKEPDVPGVYGVIVQNGTVRAGYVSGTTLILR